MNPTETKAKMRHFGFVIGVFFAVLAFLPLLKGKAPRLYFLPPAVLVTFLGVARPLVLSPFYKGWMRTGHILGRISTFIITLVIFYLIVTPLGLLKKLLGQKTGTFELSNASKTYWVKKSPVAKEDMRRLF